VSLTSNKSQENHYKSKKRLAPAPPPPALQSIMANKKGKAPAPPPPASKAAHTAINPNELNIETKPNNSLSVSSPSEASSSAFCSPISSQSSHSEQQQQHTRCSLIMPAAEAKADSVDKRLVLSDKLVQAASSPLPQRSVKSTDEEQVSEEISGILKRADSIQSINSEIDASLNNMENSIMSVGSYHRTSNNFQLIFYKINHT